MVTHPPSPGAHGRAIALTAVRSAKGGLTLPETWRLVQDLALQLGERRLAGEQRGALSPELIEIIFLDGVYRASITNAAGTSRLAGALFTAPEVVSGHRSSEATDVWIAARIAFWAAAPEVRPRIGEYLRNALSADPSVRPTLHALEAQAAEAAAAGIAVPADVPAPPTHREEASVPPIRRVGRRKNAVRILAPRWARSGFAWMAFFFVGMAALTYGLLALLPAKPPVVPPTAGMVTEKTAETPTDTLTRLTGARDRALADHDAGLLRSVSVPGSAAAEADIALLESFQGSVPVGLATQVQVANVDARRDRILIEADLVQEGFEWQGGQRHGIRVEPLPPRCAQFELIEVYGAWRVARVSACAADSMSG